MEMTRKAKIAAIVSVSLIAVISIVCVFLFGPMPMRVDWSKVHKVETNVSLKTDFKDGKPAELIKLNEDGVDETPWKVLQFTDLHYGDKMTENENTLNKMLAAIYEEKPDYVVMTGDIITSIRGRSRAVQLCNIFEKLGIYWTYVIGNHEGDQLLALGRKELMDICASYPHCLVDNTPKYTSTGEKVWGNGNCVVNLLGKDNKVVQSMIFMDTGDAISDADAKKVGVDKGSYDFLKENQMKWYEEQVNAVTENLTNGVKTMLFVHIPLVEQNSIMYIDKASYDAGKTTIPDGYTKIEGSELVYKGNVLGWHVLKTGWEVVSGTASYEGCCSSDYNNGMYALMKELGAGVNGLFCGHDHINNSILYESGAYTKENSPVYLCYGTCGGYATYSLYTKHKAEDPDTMKGYDIITIYADSSFDYTGVNYGHTSVKIPLIVGNLPVAE